MAASPQVYEVEKILARRKSRKGFKIEYLVRWKHYGSEEDSWEPVENLGECHKFIDEFNERMLGGSKVGDNGKKKKPTIPKEPKTKRKLFLNKPVKSKQSKQSKRQKNGVKFKPKNKIVNSSPPKPKKRKTVSVDSPPTSVSSLSDLSADDGVRYQLADTMYQESVSSDSDGVVTFKNSSGAEVNDCATMNSILTTDCTSIVACAGNHNKSKGPSIMTPLSKKSLESQAATGLHSPSKFGYFVNSPVTSYKSLLGSTPKKHLPERNVKRKLSEISDDEELVRRVSVRQSESVYKYKEIVVKKASGYTQIWLFTNTPTKNAINPQVCKELINALYNATHDDSRVVMLSGSGSTFCSGIDLNYFAHKTVEDKKQTAREMADALRELVDSIIKFPKLLVAAVNGPAVGLGVAILPLCDIVYASDKACFHTPYARIAQTPEGCSSYTFPLIMGPAMANEMLLGCRKLTAIEACQKGLVSQVFWPTSFMQEVIPRLQNLAAVSIKGLQVSKALIRSHSKAKLLYTNESECQALQERWGSTECYKAIKSYVEDEKDDLCL